MEDLYPVLKMAYHDVKVISRQAGMYLCSDKNPYEQGILYKFNEVDPRGIDLLSMSFGKSWVAMLYKDRNLELIDKQDGKVMESFCNISSISKQNIYRDRYSTLTIKFSGERLEKVIIIDNKKARVIAIYDNVHKLEVNSRSQYELKLSMYDSSDKSICVGITYNMKGVLLNHET